MSTIMGGWIGKWPKKKRKNSQEEINRERTETKLLRNVIKIVSKAGVGGGSPC